MKRNLCMFLAVAACIFLVSGCGAGSEAAKNVDDSAAEIATDTPEEAEGTKQEEEIQEEEPEEEVEEEAETEEIETEELEEEILVYEEDKNICGKFGYNGCWNFGI